ncbi:MAG TPA: YhdP family protein [Dokdonella sp.]|uniref:YhdP family protein n=1 Tax=Dokdonella sp. TaxID=2291710 RepID=UPI002D7E55A4|nr:YhdP family protein [Dokdonella sp.]HET9032930.1 YhdP family protein [Dokdonella sp.]
MTPFRRRLRKLRFFLQAAFVTLVISAAVLVAFAQLALPWLADNPQRIEQWLTERLGRQVSIGHVSGLWTRSGPRLVIDDLRIAASSRDEGELRLPRSELALNLYAAFQRNRAWNEFRVVGLDLALRRSAAGEWKLRGFDLDTHGEASMGALGVVVLVDMQLAVVDPEHNIDLAMRIPELRVVNLGRITRVLGRAGNGVGADAPLSLIADIDMQQRSGRLYVGGKQLDFASLLAAHDLDGVQLVSATGDLQAWASWQHGLVEDVNLQLALEQTILQSNREIVIDPNLSVQPRSAFDALTASARWQRRDAGWRFDLANFSVSRQGKRSAEGRLILEYAGAQSGVWKVAANGLEVDAIAPIAMLSESTPERLRRWLYRGNPRGSIDAIHAQGRSAQDYDVDVAVSDFSVHDDNSIPGIDSLSARLRGDAQGLLLEIPDQRTRIDYAHVFRKPFELVHFGGDIAAWKEGEDWHLQTHRLTVEGKEFAVALRGGVQFQAQGSRPAVDLSAVVARGNVEAAKMFWPTTSMPPSAIEWLDRALQEGEVTAGRAMIHGDLDHWPFDDNTGRFEARAELEGLKLAYLPDWPSGEDLSVSATFINNGMTAVADSGKTLGLTVDNAKADIADFHEPVLVLSADGHGAGKDLLSYLRATPVGEDHADYLAGLAIGGAGVTHIDLEVPLKHNEDSKLDGRVDLSNADLDESTWDLHFKKANGRVRFTRSSVVADALDTSFEGFPVALGVAIGSAASDPANAFEASLTGVLPVNVAFAKASGLEAAFPRFPGQANWHVGLAIGSDNGPAKGRNRLTLASDLQGIAIDLPEPLAKPADTALPFSLTLDMPPLGRPFSASLGDILQINGRLPSPTSSLSANLELGPSASTEDLPASGIRINGHAKSFDVGGWIGLFSQGGGSGDLLHRIAIDVDDLQLAGRSFPNLHLDLKPDGEAMKIEVAGESLQGELTVPTVELHRRGITAQMKRVRWPDLVADEDAAPAVLSRVDPTSIPPLHLWIGELFLGESNFGDMRLESFPTQQGMRLDLLETRSSNMDMSASGDWLGSADENHSHLVIDMSAENLGKMLDTFGFSGIIEGGQTVAHIDATFPGSPAAFALANATGSLNISVDKGRILDIDPGAGGRLFGLFSLREIPRRLSLDFSDLFKSGMSFNSIKGSFKIEEGSAQTDGLHIASPAADVTISGRTDLRKHQFDQEISVTPRAGVALPVVGALAGGPVGAAAGLVMQTLIGKSLNKAARSRYKVTGSWEKPVIALIGRETITTTDEEPGADSGDGLDTDSRPAATKDDAMIDPVQKVIDALPVLKQDMRAGSKTESDAHLEPQRRLAPLPEGLAQQPPGSDDRDRG